MNRFHNAPPWSRAPSRGDRLAADRGGAYWWLAYAGDRLLAEWQLQPFHQYYPTNTGIITIILCSDPGDRRDPDHRRQRASAPGAKRPRGSRSYAERLRRKSAWIQSRRRRLTGLG